MEAPATLILSQEHRRAILKHARKTLPEECCGVLVGEVRPAERRVTLTFAALNVSPKERHRRYAVDPEVLLAAHKAARAAGMDVVGYYHSHPEDPAVPSVADARGALPGASYLIVSLASAGCELRSWRARRDGGGFAEEIVRIEHPKRVDAPARS